MNITVFGGSGQTGRELIRLALADGHKVTAVVRNPSALADPPPGLTVRAGDVLDAESLAGAVDGADAVLSALGGSDGRAPTTVYSAGTENISAAMRAAGVRRLVVVTASPIAPPEQRRGVLEGLAHRVLWAVLRGPYQDMARLEAQLRGSELDWTVVRPPRLLTKPGTGSYRVAVDGPLRGAWTITRADLARAMLAALDDPATVRTALTVAN